MPVFPLLMLAFLLIPIAEIYVLITVGGLVGVGATILLVVATAVIGAALMRAEGLATLRRIQSEMGQGGLPAQSLIEGVMLLFAGALLLTPGFLTDALGFFLLFRPTRFMLARWFIARTVVQMQNGRGGVGATFSSGGGFSSGASFGSPAGGAPRSPAGGSTTAPRTKNGGVIEGEFSYDDK